MQLMCEYTTEENDTPPPTIDDNGHSRRVGVSYIPPPSVLTQEKVLFLLKGCRENNL